MSEFLNSKLFLTIEHAAKVAIFLALSTFFTELLNSNFASLLIHYLPAFITVGMINLFLAGAVKYIDLKKTEVIEEPVLPTPVTPTVVQTDVQQTTTTTDAK